MSRLLFRSAIFLGAFLLFLSEPIAAKQLLPVFGGSAAVWMTCLVFFQVALLGGYLYAHAITRGVRSHAGLHIGLLALAVVSALAWASGLVRLRPAGTHPVLSIFAALAMSIGLPFLMLASTSPLLQAWLARREQGGVAYRLFALSNLASFLALLAYPTLIEPHVSLSLQRWVWAVGVGVFAAVEIGIVVGLPSPLTREGNGTSAEVPGPKPLALGESKSWGLSPTLIPSTTARARVLWFLLPMAAAMQLSAVTAHLTSNVAAIPMLWVVPLAVYLLTFILAFQMPRIVAYRGILLRLLAVMLAALAWVLSHTDLSLQIGAAIGFFVVELFLACLFCHVETYALRPEGARESTLFYLVIAAGGATGSFLIGIAAPLVFSGNYDLGITFLVTALLALAIVWNEGWGQQVLWAAGCGLLVFVVFGVHKAYMHDTLMATRNFYGSLRVQEEVTDHGDPMRVLVNGTIQHGTQIFSGDLMRVPTTYYAQDSGIGLALKNCCEGRPRRMGVVGLGAGTLAAYGRKGDSIRFYEINPAVLPIAENVFSYLRQSEAEVSFAEGDARASLTQEASQQFDVLVVDAFSGDAIPLHLLTVEALAVYRRHLAPGGILAFHVSNLYINLQPEIAALAASAGLDARTVDSAADDQSGEFRATWVLVPEDRGFFEKPDVAGRVETITPVRNVRAWTDNYSSLLPLVHW